MRKSREETAQTRKQIVTAAASQFRKNGVVATGLSDLMKAAGLTHGGFYKHFESKDQLVAEACTEAVNILIEKMASAGSSAGATYLSTDHRDHPEQGCPLSAIGSELSRTDDKTREVATDGILRLVEIMASHYDNLPKKAARKRALIAASTMIGAMTLARIVTDTDLSTEILKEAEKGLSLNS